VRGAESAETTQLVRAPRAENLPLSYAQQRLWFLDQLEGEHASYNMPSAVRLRGELNERALQRALEEIVRRHEALRSHFRFVAGQTLQIISDSANLQFQFVDLSHLSADQAEVEARKLASETARQIFDLS